MQIEMQDTLELQTAAALTYGVSPVIHSGDYIYRFMIESAGDDRAAAVQRYFGTGADSAERLMSLIQRFQHPAKARPSVLEFASGYGGVTRHLARHGDTLELVPCDIHPEAITFLEQEFGLKGLTSATAPDHLTINRHFDVVFALSFFTHMPSHTWATWLRTLFNLVDDGGIFIFTTHGLRPWRLLDCPQVSSSGFYFTKWSEQQDLSTDDYGVTITFPCYVFERLAELNDAEVLFFEAAYWSGHQDVIVLRRNTKLPSRAVDIDEAALQLQKENVALTLGVEALQKENGTLTLELEPLQKENVVLTLELEAQKTSTSWRLTEPLRYIKTSLARLRR